MNARLWIFGYGSLIWRPDLPYDRARLARLSGWRRGFWQGSPDHRGTPAAPGRVVTLQREEGAHLWGRAYRVAPGEEARVLAQVDHREVAGYERASVLLDARPDDAARIEGPTEPLRATVYIAGPGNPEWLGEAPAARLAAHIAAARGPSGTNASYARELGAALAANGARDPHVEGVIAALDALEAR